MNVFLRIGLMSALLPAAAMNSAVYADNSDNLSGSVCFGNAPFSIEQDMTKSLFVGSVQDHHYNLLKGPVVKSGTALVSSDDEDNVYLDDTYSSEDEDQGLEDFDVSLFDDFFAIESPEKRRLYQMNMIRDLNALAYNMAVHTDHTEEQIHAKNVITTDIIERLQSDGFTVRGFSGLTGTTKNIGGLRNTLAGLIGNTKAEQKIIHDIPGVTAFKGTDMHLAFRGTHLPEGWRTNLYDDAVDPLQAGIYELMSFFRLQAGTKPLSVKKEQKLIQVIDQNFVQVLKNMPYERISEAVDVCLHSMRNHVVKDFRFTAKLSTRQHDELRTNIIDLVKAVRPLKGIRLHAGFYTKMMTCLPSIRQQFLAHYRTLTAHEIVDSVLRGTGHSQGAGLTQIFAVLSKLVYIWQAEVLREQGELMTAAMVENTPNGLAKRVKIHCLSCPSAVYGLEKDVNFLSKLLGANEQFLIQNVEGDIVTVAPKASGFWPLGLEIFENSDDFVQRLKVNDRDCQIPVAHQIAHRHYGNRDLGFAHSEATDFSREKLVDAIKTAQQSLKAKAKAAKKKSWWKWS